MLFLRLFYKNLSHIREFTENKIIILANKVIIKTKNGTTNQLEKILALVLFLTSHPFFDFDILNDIPVLFFVFQFDT